MLFSTRLLTRLQQSSPRLCSLARQRPSFRPFRAFSNTATMSWYGDGREPRLLEHLKGLPESQRNTPTSVLAAIDGFMQVGKKNYLMNIGAEKGKIVTDVIADEKPKIMAELGGYVGYSAVLFANEMIKCHGEDERKKGSFKYYSLEISEEFAGIMREVIGMAGLSDVVEVIVGTGADSLALLHNERKIDNIDLFFIDHFDQFYVPDLRTAEELGLVKPGKCTVIADNIISPGCPEYAKYIRLSDADKKAEYPPAGDRKEVYYESKMVKATMTIGTQQWEDAVEISKCAGYLE